MEFSIQLHLIANIVQLKYNIQCKLFYSYNDYLEMCDLVRFLFVGITFIRRIKWKWYDFQDVTYYSQNMEILLYKQEIGFDDMKYHITWDDSNYLHHKENEMNSIDMSFNELSNQRIINRVLFDIAF